MAWDDTYLCRRPSSALAHTMHDIKIHIVCMDDNFQVHGRWFSVSTPPIGDVEAMLNAVKNQHRRNMLSASTKLKSTC